MKNIISILIVFVLLSCQSTTTEEMPEDLASLKALLQEKKMSQKELNDEISMLEDKIISMDSSIVESAKLVTLIKPEKKDFKHFVTIQGNVKSDAIVNASSEIGGRIVKLLTEEGKYVKNGQLIATVDMESVTKHIAEVEKSLELANEVFERQSRLWEQKIGSEIQYLQAKNNKERLEKSLETLNFQLTKADVHAPISGVVDMVFLKEGELAAPGAPIVKILNTSRLKVVADAPENLLGSINLGNPVQVIFPALADTVATTISMIGRSIDAANRTFEIEMNVPSKGGLLKPNLLAEIRVNDFTQEDVFTIPLELVQQEVGGKDFLMIAKKEGDKLLAEKLYVTTGDSDGGEIIIESGLREDHDLVMTGARGLANHEVIEVINSQTIQ
ncbi:MAG: efflux RND transporter periplasmic adaptor subunit [Saprospiraceae bacterium]|nr:efflux RND transporter periplasmic adaptor subunit [Saprospiraceae bacterium]